MSHRTILPLAILAVLPLVAPPALAQTAEEFERLQALLRNRTDEVTQLREHGRQLAEQNEQLRAQVSSLRAQLAETPNDSGPGTLAADLEDAQLEAEALRAQLAALENEHHEDQRALTETRALKERRAAELESLRYEAERHGEEILRLRGELDRERGLRKSLEERLTEAEAPVARIARLESELEEAGQELTRARRDASAAHDRIRELEVALVGSRSVEERDVRLDAASRRNATLERQLEDARNDLADARRAAASAESRVAELETQSESAPRAGGVGSDEDFDALWRELARLSRTNEELTAERARLQEQLTVARNETIDLRGRLQAAVERPALREAPSSEEPEPGPFRQATRIESAAPLAREPRLVEEGTVALVTDEVGILEEAVRESPPLPIEPATPQDLGRVTDDITSLRRAIRDLAAKLPEKQRRERRTSRVALKVARMQNELLADLLPTLETVLDRRQSLQRLLRDRQLSGEGELLWAELDELAREIGGVVAKLESIASDTVPIGNPELDREEARRGQLKAELTVLRARVKAYASNR